jgi:hypothetical protein
MGNVTGTRTGISITPQGDAGFINTDVDKVTAALPGPLGSGAKIFQDVKAGADSGKFDGTAIGTLASDGATFVNSCMDTASGIAGDPIGWLVGQGLNFLIAVVQPLQDVIHFVSGDGPALATAAGNFGNIGKGLQDYGKKFVTDATASLADWHGEAAEAAATKLARFSRGIDGIAGQAGDIAQLLQISSMVMQVVEDFVKALLTELVTWLIMIWLPALAAAVPTFGGSTAAAGAETGVMGAETGAKAAGQVGKLQRLLSKIQEFLAKLKTWLGELKTNFNRIMDTKAMRGGLAKLEVGAAKEAGGRASPGTRLMNADGGMIGTRLYQGEARSFGAAAKKAGFNALGLGRATDKHGNFELPTDAKRMVQTGIDAGKKAYGYEQGGRKAVGYGEIGDDRTPEETTADLEF